MTRTNKNRTGCTCAKHCVWYLLQIKATAMRSSLNWHFIPDQFWKRHKENKVMLHTNLKGYNISIYHLSGNSSVHSSPTVLFQCYFLCLRLPEMLPLGSLAEQRETIKTSIKAYQGNSAIRKPGLSLLCLQAWLLTNIVE